MPDLANPAILGPVLVFLLGLITLIGGGVKWLIPYLMERGRTKARTVTRVAASDSTVEFLKGLVKTYSARVDELEAEVARLQPEARGSKDE